MRIDIPRVMRPVRLSDYAPEYGDQVVQMWVNPPREKRLAFANITQEYGEIQAQIESEAEPDNLPELMERVIELAGQMYAWYAEMWSQGDDEWTAEEVGEVANAAVDSDPGMWAYLQERSLDVMQEYRRRKKANTPGQRESP